MREAVAAMMTIAWGSRPRSAIARLFVVVGVITTLCLMITVCLLAVGWWQWQKEGDAIESPSKRYAVWHATIVYPRLRFGIGSEFHRGAQVDYVLGTWSAEERAALPERCGRCVEAIQTLTTAGLATAMGAFNNT